MTQQKLHALAERAFKWSALTTGGRFALQLVAQVLLARLLGPSNYGVYGIGLVVLTFVTFLSGNSFSYTLLLQKDVTEEDVRFSFTLQTIAGAVGALAMFFGAGLMAGFFADPRIEPMLQWLALACLLIALTGPSNCLLQRDLKFRDVGLIQLGSYGAGYLLVAVPMALNGFGPQALAAGCVVQAAVALAASFAVHPHALRPLLRHPLGVDRLETSRTVFFTNIVNWLLTNLDRLVIGRVLNTHAVGLYSVAYNIASIPYTLLIGALQPAFLATGAKLHDQPEQLAQAWLTLLACVAVFLIPAALAMGLLAPDLVEVLYGSAWSEAGWVMAVMFFCLPAWTSLGLSTPMLWNTGRKHLEAGLQLPLLALLVPAWWLLAPHGLRAVVVVAALFIFARAAVVVVAVLRALGLHAHVLGPMLMRGLVLGAVCTGAVLVGRGAAAPLHHPLATLFGGLMGALAMLLLVAVRPQVLGSQARGVLSRVIPAVGGGSRPPAP